MGAWLNGILAFWMAPAITSASPIDIPFSLHSGHLIVIRGAIGNLEDLNFVIDTGSTTTVVSDRVARKLRLDGKEDAAFAYGMNLPVKMVTLPSLTLGNTRLEHVDALQCRLKFRNISPSVRIDALIGMNVLRQRSLTIDYESRRISIGRSADSAFASLSVYCRLPYVDVPVVTENKVLRLLLDTGAAHLILYGRKVKNRLALPRSMDPVRLVHQAGTVIAERVRLRELSLGDARWKRLPVLILDRPPLGNDFDGILGVTALALKRLHLDFENQRMSWQR